MRTCTKCGQTLDVERFSWANKERTRRRGDCKTCAYRPKTIQQQRKAQRKHRYGVDDTEFTRMMVEQEGMCAICAVVLDEDGERSLKPCVDHCHTSGHVRGILCHRCNAALGLLDDDIERLQKAQEYLQGR